MPRTYGKADETEHTEDENDREKDQFAADSHEVSYHQSPDQSKPKIICPSRNGKELPHRLDVREQEMPVYAGRK